MNTVQMECFIAVYQTLSFSKAANRLHLSQPAVSHQIISMENELETSLFVRTNKFVTPTQQAKQIRPHIEHILEIQKSIQSELATPARQVAVPFEICCHNQLELDLISKPLHELLILYPGLRPILHCVSTQTDEQLLQHHIVSLTFGLKREKIPDNIAFEKLGEVMIACVTSDYMLKNVQCVDVNEIRENVLFSQDLKAPEGIISMQNRLMRRLKINQIQFCETFESITALVKAGVGVTFRPDIKKGRDPSLRYLPLIDSPKLIFGVYHRKDDQNQHLIEFIRLLKRYF